MLNTFTVQLTNKKIPAIVSTKIIKLLNQIISVFKKASKYIIKNVITNLYFHVQTKLINKVCYIQSVQNIFSVLIISIIYGYLSNN